MGKEAEFLEACKEGNVIKVEHLLASKTKKYIVPIFSKSASTLLQSKDPRGSTALHLASLNGRKAVVYLLLDEGADVHAADENGCLPLHLASWNGHLDIVSALITHDPRQESINALNKNQETALHYAAQYGHYSIVSLLLKNGALPALRNVKGETPLDLASKYGRLEVVRCLLDHNPHLVLNALVTDPKQGDAQLPPPFSPLHLASKNGKTEVVRLLLDSGFDINFFTEEGTALHVAALFGKIDVVKLLLERGINADARDFHGRTALELLEEHQTEKPVLLSHLLPNRDAWQHCSSMINEHLERSSDASTVSKEVAAIYLNSLHQRKQDHQPSVGSISPPPENAVWLPVPSNSAERMNFEQGIERPPSSIQKNNRIPSPTKPLSVLTNFHVPPPPPSSECESIGSTISLTPTPSPALTIASVNSLSSPRFPVDENLIIGQNDVIKKKPTRPPRTTDVQGCTYQPPPLQYDNVPFPSAFPQTGYDNVPSNATGYDNAPPPDIHAWTHRCCKNPADGTHTNCKENRCDLGKNITTRTEEKLVAPVMVNSIGRNRIDASNHSPNKNEPKISPIRVSDLCERLHQEKQAAKINTGGTMMSVKFAEAPPETLYLPVESKLYTRMDQPFTTNSPVLANVTEGEKKTKQPTVQAANYGPYDNVPATTNGLSKQPHQQKKSPDFGSPDIDRELSSMKLIEETIQVIEQSSKDMEENVDALVRCSSRSSERSNTNIAVGSRPTTPPSPVKKKIPPPVSPKPKVLLIRAPLAQPEPDDLGASTDSVDVKSPVITITSSSDERKTVPKRSHHRSASRRRSSIGHERAEKATDTVALGGSAINVQSISGMKRSCVDHEAQVDSGTASSECCGSVCSCSGGSRCSLASSRAVSEVNGDQLSPRESNEQPDVVNAIDEPAEWNQIEAIFKSCGTGIARLSMFDSEIQPNLVNYLKGDEAKKSPGTVENVVSTSSQHTLIIGTVEHWLNSIGMQKYEDTLMSNGFDRLEFLKTTLDENTLRYLGISAPTELGFILLELQKLPHPKTRAARTFRYVSDWLQAYGCQDYLGEFVKSGYDTIWNVQSLDAKDLEMSLGPKMLLGHRLRLATSLVNEEKLDQSKIGAIRMNSFPLEQQETSAENSEKPTTFSAHYLGSTLIEDVTGIDATRASMTKLKKSTKEISKVPQVVLEIDWRGVRLHDSATRRPLCEHTVQNIHCVCQDERDMNCFAYITKDGSRHFCHVFSVLTADIATELILTLGKAFDVAYQKAIRSVSS